MNKDGNKRVHETSKNLHSSAKYSWSLSSFIKSASAWNARCYTISWPFVFIYIPGELLGERNGESAYLFVIWTLSCFSLSLLVLVRLLHDVSCTTIIGPATDEEELITRNTHLVEPTTWDTLLLLLQADHLPFTLLVSTLTWQFFLWKTWGI